MQDFTIEEFERFKNEITKTNECGEPCLYYGYAFSLILNTGLRIAEALSLCWDDIDFERKAITVNKNKILAKKRDDNGNKIGGYELLFQDSTKTISGNRIIPINKSAEVALYALKKNNNTKFVIVNQRQNQILPSNFERAFHNVLKKANIKKCGLHVLRHTFASMLFSKGVDVKIVSKLLGHSTVKITYDIYVHLFEQDLSNITNVLD
jgi:integrase